MKRLFLFLCMAFAMFGLGIGKPAQAAVTYGGVTCTNYHDLYPSNPMYYPNDGTTDATSHFFICFNATAGDVGTYLGAVGHVGTTPVQTLFINSHVVYYFFQNRADAVAFVSARYSPSFANANSRCGNTYGYGSQVAVQVYKTCTLSTGTTITSDISTTSRHESGHAFDFALSRTTLFNGQVPSQSKAWWNLVDGVNNGPSQRSDMYRIVLGYNGQGNTPPPTCNIFPGTAHVDALEQDLGLPTVSSSPVCVSSVVQTPYVGLSNSQIAKKNDPYFLDPTNTHIAGNGAFYGELFAQEYLTYTGSEGNALPFIDSYIGQLVCSRSVAMSSLVNSIALPTASLLSNNSCPPVTAADWTTQH